MIPPVTTDAELRAMLDGLPQGWYTVRELYPRYQRWAASVGREPSKPIGLAMALRRLGLEDRRAAEHVREYWIN